MYSKAIMTHSKFSLIYMSLIGILAAFPFPAKESLRSTETNLTAQTGTSRAAVIEIQQQGKNNMGAVKVYDARRDTLVNVNDAAPAPPLAADGTWINSEPLMLEALHGRVVLLDFWSYRCPYCRNALPELSRLDARFRKRGLTVIGIHSPMMESDKVLGNVRAQVNALGVRYAVVTDNGHRLWDAFEMEAWPTVVLLDKAGHIRFTHVGEGMYKETEDAIKKLLAE